MLLILTTINFSCSTDEVSVKTDSLINARPIIGNSLNPYEDLGIISYDLFHLYTNSLFTATSIDDISKNVSDLMFQYTNLNQPTIHLDSNYVSLVESIIYYPEEELEALVSENKISSLAEARIRDILEIISDDSKPIKSEIFNNLISYEIIVLSDGNLSTSEKELILLSSTFFRYSLYDSGGDDDKDWDLSVGKFIISIHGALSSIQDAVLMNVSTRIYLSKE